MIALDALIRDLRTALRCLRRRPGFTAATLATLALGIGATTAIFSVVRGVLLRPLPFPEPARLVRLFQAHPEREVAQGAVSQLDVEDWGAAADTLSDVGLYSTLSDGLTLTGGERPEKVATAFVSGGFFPTLGVAARTGRTLGPADLAGDELAVVVSWDYWLRRFAGDPAIVGTTLTLNGEPTTVAGVMPPGFRFPTPDVEMWAPLTRIPESSIPRGRQVRWLDAVGRLAPGAAAADARSELSGIAARLAETYPDSNRGATAVTVVPLLDGMVGEVRPALVLLLAAVGALLLVGCANLAHLMLAHALARRTELAIRGALGASRRRLFQQLLVESLALALVGGGLGTLVALWGVEGLGTLAAGVLPRATEIRVDGAILAFAVALSVATALLFGVLPALRASRPSLERDLREGQRRGDGGDGGGGGRRIGRPGTGGLVVAEVTLALVLVVTAGLLARSLGAMLRTDPGFASQRLLALTLIVPAYRYPERPQYLGTYHRMMDELAAVPGVESVASTKTPPLRGSTGVESMPFRVEGGAEPAAGDEPRATWHPVSRGYFRTLGIPLLAGRDFASGDDADAPLVAAVNRSLAARYLPGEDPVGRTLLVGDRRVEIIALVADARDASIVEDPRPTLYLHVEQVPRRVFTVLLRTRGAPAEVVESARLAIWAVDPDQPILLAAPVEEIVGESLARPRLVASLVGLFAALALVLAAVGVYGVLSHAVGRRTHEIGVRMALGADGRRVLAQVMAQGGRWIGAGVVLGLGASLAATRLIAGQLYDLSPADPLTFAASALVLAAVALAACLVPALRAAATDPLEVLRDG